jgi:deoxyribodipyrimidine photo-lyase
MGKINIWWLRRDLRLHDNTALHYAIQDGLPVLPVFIFDTEILDKLDDKKDARVEFIHTQLTLIHQQLQLHGSGVYVMNGRPQDCYQQLLQEYEVAGVYTNRDYEPYAKERDAQIDNLLQQYGGRLYTFKDHVIFEQKEITTDAGDAYKVYTPYKNKWMSKFAAQKLTILPDYSAHNNFVSLHRPLPALGDIGFESAGIPFPSKELNAKVVSTYDQTRNFPSNMKGTSRLGVHLRFGTLSIREAVDFAQKHNQTWLNELIWRDFYAMVLANFPQLPDNAFKSNYDAIPWRKDTDDFQRWCDGKTGFPIVDAGMRELNATGYMHNRVRMITASFLTKHLLLDWRWGEAYFAKKLLDFDLASNNGGWQWAAGTGTDAQPYFRVFNPDSQTEKFDKELKYIKKWLPEFGTPLYPKPMVDHKFARNRAIETYKQALSE